MIIDKREYRTKRMQISQQKMNKMYKKNKMRPSSIKVNTAVEGETIEMKIERIVNNNEPIKDGAEILYQTRDEGVNPAYDPRTDRWDIAIDHAGKGADAQLKKRQDALKKLEKQDGKTESGDGQDNASAEAQSTKK